VWFDEVSSISMRVLLKLTCDSVVLLRFVALELLKNANVAAGMVLPGCQDTGTAIVMGKKGQYVWTEGNDEEALSRGIFDAYSQRNLRYSQVGHSTVQALGINSVLA
jgi:tartrate dehydratase alpha subunit/fumarate hydratase class I-like protein